jgi:hypothetical protein
VTTRRPGQRRLSKKHSVRVRVGGEKGRWVNARVLGVRRYPTWTELELDYVVKFHGSSTRVRMLVDASSGNLRQLPGGYPLPARKAAPPADPSA